MRSSEPDDISWIFGDRDRDEDEEEEDEDGDDHGFDDDSSMPPSSSGPPSEDGGLEDDAGQHVPRHPALVEYEDSFFRGLPYQLFGVAWDTFQREESGTLSFRIYPPPQKSG